MKSIVPTTQTLLCKTGRTLGLLALAGALSIPLAKAQNLTMPQVSQKVTSTQTIGLSEITVTYFSPKVNNREVWGNLVPYNEGKPFPWRAGANENTIVTFSDDVKIEGKDLKAGTYGLHMIPSAGDWTIIFSNNSVSWGSYFYDQSEDALRVTVKTEAADQQEWLGYTFDNPQAESVELAMRWEKLRVPIKIEVDAHAVVLQSMRDELRGVAGFSWQGYQQAANYCAQNNMNHEEAMEWSDRSIRMNPTFTSKVTKATLLMQMGKGEEAKKMEAEALKDANMNDLNNYGYALIGQGKTKRAVQIFEMNAKKNPKDANVHDSLGEGYYRNGQKEDAIKAFKKALSLNPSPNTKANSLALLKEMGVEMDGKN